ncbi:hypothetical protein LCGC14_1765520 [marine sediment metagenome]|uniref:HNH domain-containing protein n=1 Tax=marine sediment metagenome TaxID=412755 RepID=A0A0F9HMA7_9ZZZZ
MYPSQTKQYRREYTRKWRKETGNKWWHKNPESHRRSSAKWKKNNPQRVKDWIEQNREYLKRYHKEYYYRMPNKKRANQARAILRRAGGVLTPATIQRVYEDNIKKHGTLTCYLCEKSVEFGQDSLEHKIPLSRNGTNEYNNLAIAHRSCNYKKSNKTEEEYRNVERVL